MAESVLLGAVASQSSLLVLDPSSRFGLRTCAPPSAILRLHQSSIETRRSAVSFSGTKHLKPIANFKAYSLVTDNVDLSSEGIEIEPATGGNGGDDFGDLGGSGGGGGRGGGGGGDQKNNEGEGESGGEKKKMALSMSQKLTIGYAALVGMGGLMGYLKSGSQKSLLAGGFSASLLFYVNSQLPTNPVYASSIGLGVSSVLLGVMGSRFFKSKKIFPAGVVSLISLVMTGGYIHGILRSMH